MRWPRLFKAAETKESAVGGLLVQNLSQPVWSGRDYRAFADEGYRRNVVVYQAVNKIAEAVTSAHWTAWKGSTELLESPLLDLLANPNPMQSGDEYLHASVAYLMLSGNRYDEAVTAGGVPKELYSLRPDRMKVLPGRNGFPAGYVYTVNQRSHTWPVDPATFASDIRHDKLFNPLDDWYGMSPIEAGAYAVDLHNGSMSLMQSLLQNSARPSGALSVDDDLPTENYNRLKAQIEDQYQGTRNAGRPMLLEGGMKWTAMGLSPRDMDILEGKYSSARDICLAFGVPPQLMGIPGDNTYSNYQEARLAFWEDTVIPLVDRVANDWTRWLGPFFGDVEIKPDLDQIPAIAEKRKVLWDMADKAMDLTINERREIKGYPPLPKGDVLLVSANQIGLADALAVDDAKDKQPAVMPDDDQLTADEAKALAYGLGLTND